MPKINIFSKIISVGQKLFFVWSQKTLTVLVIFNMLATSLAPALAYPVTVDTSSLQPLASAVGNAFLKLTLTDVAHAQPYASGYVMPANPMSIIVSDDFTHTNLIYNETAAEARSAAQIALDKATQGLKESAFLAANQTLNAMINSFAYDVATWLASGGKGQQPMFFNQGWGEYMKSLVDDAAGNFIESLAGNWLDFNVCEPINPSLKISIGLGLSDLQRPRKPQCSLSDMVHNWSSLINDKNFLNRFDVIYDPDQNDIGIAFSIFNKYNQEISDELDQGIKDRTEGGGFKAVVAKISKAIKTPSSLVFSQATRLTSEQIDQSDKKVQFGPIVLNAVDTFVSTLIGKLFQRLFKEGLAGDSTSNNPSASGYGANLLSSLLGKLGQNNNDLYSANQTSLQGQSSAQVRFLDLLTTGNNDSKPMDVLTKLTFCPDPKNPGPDECVILPSFAQAVQQGMTLAEAINRGLIDGNAPFGRQSNDPTALYSGLPYRSVVILRTYRIVPVSWEVAAKAINKFDGGKNISLNDLIAQYQDPTAEYYDLVNPNWVLVAPDHLCKETGFGPKILYNESVNGFDANQNGSFNDTGDIQPNRLIGRAEYCADYQSCIQKNDDGSCQYYGYCAEERPVWDFSGGSCKPYYNTCQTFQAPAGDTVSYLKNSLNYNGCSADNAGCQWYCQILNPINNVWTCQNQTERVLKACSQNGGCSVAATCTLSQGETACTDANSSVNLTIASACDSGSRWWNDATSKCDVDSACTIEKGAVSCSTDSCFEQANLLANGSFETPAANPGGLASGWTTDSGTLDFFDRVSGATEKIYDGKSSIRFYTAGQLIGAGDVKSITSSSLALATSGTYTFSARVYSKLNAGNITLSVYDSSGQIASRVISDKNRWQIVSFDFTTSQGSVWVVASIASQGTFLSGTAWFDDFRITPSCVINPVTLNLVGTVEQNESKIHLDRDASDCPSEAAGCSQFIRTIPNSGTNIVDNSSFEDWPNPTSLPTGWNLGENNSAITTEKVNDSPIDNYSLKINNDGVNGTCRDFDSGVLSAMKPNTTYRVSFWAKSDSDLAEADGQWYAEILSNHVPNDYYCSLDNTANCDPFNEATCSAVGKGVCVGDWQLLQISSNQYLSLTANWQRFVLNPITTRAAGVDFKFAIDNCSTDTANPIYLDGVQIEEVSTNNPVLTDYKDYGQTNLTYLKKPPVYLNCTGDSTDSDACANYAPYCKPEEVGCQAFAPLSGGAKVPAVIRPTDFCPAECVGYQAYKQSATPFETQQTLEYFISSTAKQCNASAAGCDEFTNLDEVTQGGEGREYYSYLRLCQKPADVGASCQSFYTWQGSDETGFQLKTYSLTGVADAAGHPIPTPAISNIDSWPDRWCSDKTLDANGLPNCCDAADDLVDNPFCKQFFAGDGSVSYQIYDNTISCSDDCHPYRKTSLGEDPTVAETNCNESHGVWDNGACVYQAIPGQGLSCSANFAGCREYRGNQSGNIYTALTDNLESGETANWIDGVISSEALSVGGHSLKSTDNGLGGQQAATFVGDLGTVCSDNLPACSATVTTNCYDQSTIRCWVNTGGRSCRVNVGDRYCGVAGNTVKKSKSYILNFWAKASSAVQNFTVEIGDRAIPVNNITIGQSNLNADWGYYSMGPFTVDDKPAFDLTSAQLRFKLGTAVTFYLDNIQLKEVTGHTYVIKNSWQTPMSCDTNPYLNPPIAAPQYMLNCQQYRSSTGAIYNLKSFDSLCRETAVGCEAMIDTYNSASPVEQKFNPNDTLSDVTIPADKLVYLVNRPEFQCASTVKGCEAVGLPSLNTSNNVTAYSTAYKINDPDKYDTILCKNEEVGCQEYVSETGSDYFKAPGDKVCEYRTIPGTTNLGWFIRGSVSNNPDCPVTQPSVGALHPDGKKGFAGLCPSEYNTCTQFIDPINNVGKNLLYNGNLSDINNDGTPEGWDILASQDGLVQSFKLKANTSYTLNFVADINNIRGSSADLTFTVNHCPGIFSYDHSLIYDQADNTLMKMPEDTYNQDNRTSDNTSPDYIEGLSNFRQYSARFSVPEDQDCQVQVKLAGATVAALKAKIKQVGLRETGVYYALGNSVDKIGCNGIVNPEKGCVLFNDRSGVNYKLGEDDISYLAFDADVSGPGVNGGVGVTDCAGNCDANAVINVRPDRTCESWLNCSVEGTYLDNKGIARKYCAQIGLCDRMDASGQCTNQVIGNKQSLFGDPEQIKNLSGYSSPGLIFTRGICVAPADNKGMTCNQNSDCATDASGVCDKSVSGVMSFEQMIQQGQSFRVPNGNFELAFGATTEPIGWSTIIEGTNTEPVEWYDYKFRVDRDVNNVIEGTGYLRLNSFWETQSEEIDVAEGELTTISAMINTQFLENPASQLNPTGQAKAQILVKALDSNGAAVAIKDASDVAYPMKYNGWQLLQNANTALEAQAGLDWQQKSFTFKMPIGAVKFKIKLSNYIDEAKCIDAERYNRKASNCSLGGYSLFDSISLKPILKVRNELPDDSVARSCRLYPTSDALACVNMKDNAVYFGQYGYCVTTDPQNPSQCLQWWPVDQIQGETLDEVTSGYNDRVPLDYCTQKKDVVIRVGANATLTTLDLGNSNLSGNYTSMVNSSGQQMKFSQFNINDDYRALFRYPYVQYLQVHGSISGGSLLSGAGLVPTIFIPIPYGARLYKDHTCWKFISILDNPGFSDIANGALSGTNDFITNGLFSNPLLSGILGDVTFWRPGDPGHESDDYGSYCWSTSPGEDWGGFAALGLGISIPLGDFGIGAVVSLGFPYKMAQATSILTSFNTELSKLVGTMVGLAGPVAAKIITDQDESTGNTTSDPVPDLEGDILGISAQMLGQTNGATALLAPVRVNGDVPVKYCSELVRVVTSAGSNRGFANRLTAGSGFLLNDTIDGQPRQYQYYKPFDFRELLAYPNPMDYYSSDFQPFGGLVAPTNSQYPTAWDSKSSQYRQPLFFEPPMMTSYKAPYQARMGETHTAGSIEQIFGKSYGIWHWVWSSDSLGQPFDANHGGQYEIGPMGYCASDINIACAVDADCGSGSCSFTLDKVTAPWDVIVTAGDCPGNIRPTDGTLCRVLPIISNIKVNDKPQVDIRQSGLVKLTFTVKVDPDQLPITGYSVDWGDGNTTIVNGVVLRNRVNPDNPFALYHLYTYWSAFQAIGPYNLPVCVGDNCVAKIRIRAKDNWGAESGTASNPWITMSGNITIYKK
ncbi:MAG: carbohydrate binding domain-containing protein [Patescibacteria group bacterium]|nr:carbohydrate binding domain-containing protein [Patescibacteria group bacterium]